MKLRLVLFSSCTLLFSSLSSLSLNAQQEREARLRVTTSLPTLAANGAKPEFGPNVLIFDPAMPSQAIQKQIAEVYSTQEHKARKSTRLNSSHTVISYAVFCLKQKQHVIRH